MKTLLNKWFIVGCLIWLVVTILRRSGHPLPVFNGYLDDLLAIPVIANLGLWFQRVFMIRNNYYVLSSVHVTFIVVYVSVLFELVLPYYSKAYTGDWIDVTLYLAGGIFFYKIINKPIMPKKREVNYN
jgi:hypothetical protein